MLLIGMVCSGKYIMMDEKYKGVDYWEKRVRQLKHMPDGKGGKVWVLLPEGYLGSLEKFVPTSDDADISQEEADEYLRVARKIDDW